MRTRSAFAWESVRVERQTTMRFVRLHIGSWGMDSRTHLTCNNW